MNLDARLDQMKEAHEAVENTKAYKRLTMLFDEATFNEIDSFAKSGDDYAEVVAGFGSVNGCPVYAFAQNCERAGGAMSKAQAAKIKKIYDLAVKTGAPVVGMYDSIGGRLKEGADLLAAYGELLLYSNNLSGVVPQISLVVGPCIGTMAMVAASADLLVMSKKGELKIETSDADGSAQKAECEGISHITAENEYAAILTTRNLIALLPSNNLCGTPVTDYAAPDEEQDGTLIPAVVDAGSYIELQANYGKALATGLARIAGSTVGIVAASENDSILDADACSKAARFVRFCDAFAMPIITFVDFARFSSLREAAKFSNAYAEATTAKIAVITGKAYGPVYIAAAGRGANADITFAWPQAVISPLAPETAAVFLWGDRVAGSENPITDREKLIADYIETEASPFKAAAEGYVEDIIDPADTRTRLMSALDMLAGKRVARLPKKHANIQV